MRANPFLGLILLVLATVVEPAPAQQAPPPPSPANQKPEFVYPPDRPAEPPSAADPPIQVSPPPKPQPVEKPTEKLKIAGQITAPAYTPVKLHVDGMSGNVTWLVYGITVDSTGKASFEAVEWIPYPTPSDCRFDGPPGQYLAIATNGIASTPPIIAVILPPVSPSPSPSPIPGPNPNPTPVPPNPSPPDDGGFQYPPGSGGTSADVQPEGLAAKIAASLALAPDRKRAKWDAGRYADLFRVIASEVELDGDRTNPELKTIGDTADLCKKQQNAFISGTRLKGVKVAYPETHRLIEDHFRGVASSLTDATLMTPDVRKFYVAFLRSMADGFARASK